MEIKRLFKCYPIWTYLITTYVFSWSVWSILLFSYPSGVMQSDISINFMSLAMLGGIGPSLAGIMITAIVDGTDGLKKLFSGLARWRVGLRWYVAVLLICPFIALTTLMIEYPLGLQTASVTLMLATLPIAIIWPIFAAFGEEFGWRGFLLPRLLAKSTAFRASIYVGFAWGLWHIPTILLAYRQHGLLVVIAFIFVVHILAITAQSTIMTWVYNNTGKSLLVMILFHFSLTFTALFFFPLNVSVTEGLQHQLAYAVLYWVIALMIIASGRLSHDT